VIKSWASYRLGKCSSILTCTSSPKCYYLKALAIIDRQIIYL
jgi:hypothetical protein